MYASDEEFNVAKERVNLLKEDPGNEAKLEMYALFKQATVGACNTSKPGAFDFVGKAKWQAWTNLGSLSQEEAKQKYVDIVQQLLDEQGVSVDGSTATADVSSAEEFKTLKITAENGIYKIVLNRPDKKNALTFESYNELVKALDIAGKDPSIVFATLTGAGDYYCSGNDLNNFMSATPETMKDMAKEGGELLNRFVSAFIDFPKPLIGLVNGPAVGVSVTTLGLFDVVYCTDKATFVTPFSALGQSPEGCSSYVFPKIMGSAKANEVLLFGRKLTAKEAFDRGLVTDVFPDDKFQEETQKRVDGYAKLPKNSMRLSKNLIRSTEKDLLHKVNDEECTLLEERWTSDECIQAIMNFFTQKSKL
ncbi:enoyl-CoA delta isomerase 2, mitochondrial-like isoform X2 [Anneissia japonica]|nr:enoyl-CoA delta isomerase 2, mitochondrial-like isoform X2 [Anneissia japonica]